MILKVLTNEKEFTNTSVNNKRTHITLEKEITPDTMQSNGIYLTEQNYKCDGNTPDERSDSQQNYQHDDLNGNTPSDPSDHETDDENVDDEIQVGSYER